MTARFYIEALGLKEVGKINSPPAEGYSLSDGHVNLAILKFRYDGGKMEEVESSEAIAGTGLADDRYSMAQGSFNRKRPGRRQVTLINSIFFQNSGFEYAESRRNIVTQGGDPRLRRRFLCHSSERMGS